MTVGALWGTGGISPHTQEAAAAAEEENKNPKAEKTVKVFEGTAAAAAAATHLSFRSSSRRKQIPSSQTQSLQIENAAAESLRSEILKIFSREPPLTTNSQQRCCTHLKPCHTALCVLPG